MTSNATTREVMRIAEGQYGVISRRQLRAAGISRWNLRDELNARRWACFHRQAIIIHTGPLTDRAKMWATAIEAGSRAALDGVSALIAAGLVGFHTDHVRLSVPRGCKILGSPGAVVRQTRRLKPTDIEPAGVPRVRAEIAAVRGALWAQTDKQAALILVMTVQQRLATAEDIARALLDVKRDKRRRFVELVLLDILDGAQSIGELDFARECRRRGLPKPTGQIVRQGLDGRYYLDVFWRRYQLVVEIDGIHHKFGTAIIPDALRQNEVSLQDNTVLRLPLIALRVAADDFFDQIERALVDRGWARLSQAS